MSSTVLYMSMSLDGFIAGPNEGPDNGLGDGGHRLHEWALMGADAGRKAISGRLAGVNRQVHPDPRGARRDAHALPGQALNAAFAGRPSPQ
jgi:hypothetical protein